MCMEFLATVALTLSMMIGLIGTTPEHPGQDASPTHHARSSGLPSTLVGTWTRFDAAMIIFASGAVLYRENGPQHIPVRSFGRCTASDDHLNCEFGDILKEGSGKPLPKGSASFRFQRRTHPEGEYLFLDGVLYSRQSTVPTLEEPDRRAAPSAFLSTAR